MKKASLASFGLLAASAVGQNPYQVKNQQGVLMDITTQTNTVSAWKSMAGTCKLGTLVGALGAQWCLWSTDNSVYKFDVNKKQWAQQPQYGTSLHSIASAGPSNVYSLQAVGHCGVYGGQQYYGVFRWIGSWSEDATLPCASHISAAADGSMLAVIGFDSSTSKPALFYSSSNPGGTWPNVSWTLETDGLISVDIANGDVGCSVDANGGMWQIYASASPQQLPALPSGANRAVGCLYARDPDIAMAWTTTTGSVYSMPVENWGTWQQVTGLSAVGVTGLSRYHLFAQDFSGVPHHWNVNAPGMSATYGGQWNTQNGCPSPSLPCHTTTTHTLKNQVRFTSGHGLNGAQGVSTQVFTNDIEVSSLDYSPGCDPEFGPPADPECRISLAAEAHCNQSNQDVGNFSLNWVVADSIDVLDFTYNESSAGPLRHQTALYTGYYLGSVTNAVTDGCAVSDPVPQCPQGSPVTIHNQVYWFGGLDGEAKAYSDWHREQAADISGESSPYVSHSFYIAQVDDNGIFLSRQCFGGYIGKSDFLYGDIGAAPACK